MNRRRMIRRGAPYGPPLPEGAPDDGVERGIAAFVICASLIRQFEFAQNVWVNDRNFNELGNERDPIIGAHDGTLEYKIPKRPIRKKIVGLAGLHHGEGRRVLLSPGPQGAWLSRLTERTSAGPEAAAGRKGGSHVSASFRPDLQSGSHSAQIHAGQAAHEHLLDVELPVGVAARPCGDGQSVLDHDRGSPRRSGRPTRRRNGARRSSFRASRERSSCFTARRSVSRRSPAKRPAIRSRSSSASTRPATSCRSMNAFSPTPTP